MLAYFVGFQELQNGAYFHIIEQHPSVFFFWGSDISPFVSFIVTCCECCGCWCTPTGSRFTSKVDVCVVLPDGATPFLCSPLCFSRGSEASSKLLLATCPFVCLGVSLGVVILSLLLFDCEFFLFCSSSFPSLHSLKSSSASWLISPSGRNGLSHPS